jgi:hypothetical protein
MQTEINAIGWQRGAIVHATGKSATAPTPHCARASRLSYGPLMPMRSSARDVRTA